MKFTIAQEHRNFFIRNGYLELESFFSFVELEKVKRAMDHGLSKRMHLGHDKLKWADPHALFMAGRDLWREEPLIQKIDMDKKLAEIAISLFDETPLRLAYDQVFRSFSELKSPFLPSPTTLQEVSCFQNLTCSVVLRLSDGLSPPFSDFFSPYPQKAGNMILFGPDLPISFDPFFNMADQQLLLIAYCRETTVYVYEKNDPHTHQLKKEGYNFGDVLKNSSHPIVFR